MSRGMFGVESGQHHEQRRCICAAIIKAERHFVQRCHFATTHFVRNFSGFGVGARIKCGGLKSGEPSQHSLGYTGIAPQHLQRSDDPVAAKCGRVPRNASVRVGTLGRVGGQHREVRHRAAHHFIENLVRAGDRGHATAGGLVRMECRPQAPAKRKCDVFHDTGLALNRHVDRPGFVWLQLEGVRCGACG